MPFHSRESGKGKTLFPASSAGLTSIKSGMTHRKAVGEGVVDGTLVVIYFASGDDLENRRWMKPTGSDNSIPDRDFRPCGVGWYFPRWRRGVASAEPMGSRRTLPRVAQWATATTTATSTWRSWERRHEPAADRLKNNGAGAFPIAVELMGANLG